MKLAKERDKNGRVLESVLQSKLKNDSPFSGMHLGFTTDYMNETHNLGAKSKFGLKYLR